MMEAPKMTSEQTAGYEISGLLGIGSFGEVRLGRHIKSNTRVAVKIIDVTRFREETAALLAKEIKILKSLQHPGVAAVLEIKEKVPYSGSWCEYCACSCYSRMPNSVCGNCGHSGYEHSPVETREAMLIVQELAIGGEMFNILAGGKFDEDLARYYFRQLVAGVEYIHSKDVIHRDLKPENLVLDEQFNIKIVDFGLASYNPEGAGHVMHSGVGSQPYSAPEIFYSKELYQGQGYKGRPADIWSCAVILFVMLMGKPPFNRPLAKTYGSAPHLQRCKHFIRVLQGEGFGEMSASAKELLMSIFKMDPTQRPTFAKIKQSAWYNGPVPSKAEVAKIMEERARKTWQSQNKPQMYQILKQMRSELSNNSNSNSPTRPDTAFSGSKQSQPSIIQSSVSSSSSNLPSPTIISPSVPIPIPATGRSQKNDVRMEDDLPQPSPSPTGTPGQFTPLTGIGSFTPSTPFTPITYQRTDRPYNPILSSISSSTNTNSSTQSTLSKASKTLSSSHSLADSLLSKRIEEDAMDVDDDSSMTHTNNHNTKISSLQPSPSASPPTMRSAQFLGQPYDNLNFSLLKFDEDES